MPTIYRPSEGRRGRMTFRSHDPAEAKKLRNFAIGMIALTVLIVSLYLIYLK